MQICYQLDYIFFARPLWVKDQIGAYLPQIIVSNDAVGKWISSMWTYGTHEELSRNMAFIF